MAVVDDGEKRSCGGEGAEETEIVVCVTDGSYGDVLPFLAIATELVGAAGRRCRRRAEEGGQEEDGKRAETRRRRRKVFLLASEHFEELVRKANVSRADANGRGRDDDIVFVPTCSKDFYSERWGESADPNRSINSGATLVTGAKSMVERQRGIYALLERIIVKEAPAASARAPALILSHPLVSASKMFVESYGATVAEMITVLLSPIYLRSLEHELYPRCMMSWYYYLADLGLDAVLAAPINTLRRELAGAKRTDNAGSKAAHKVVAARSHQSLVHHEPRSIAAPSPPSTRWSGNIRRVCNGWLFSETLVISLFPAWFTRAKAADVSVDEDVRLAHGGEGESVTSGRGRRTVFAGFITPERAVLGGGRSDAAHVHGIAPATDGEDGAADNGRYDEVVIDDSSAAVMALRASTPSLGDDVVAFLVAHLLANPGVRFVVFTPGSLNPPNATKFFRESAAAVRTINRTAECGVHVAAIFLTKYKSVLPPDMDIDEAHEHDRGDGIGGGPQAPRSIAHFSFVSLSALLPHCHLCVHHGGIGTIGSCLSSATPSVIVPSAFDQFDNADIMTRLGVGVTISEKQFTGAAVIRAMRRLIGVGVCDDKKHGTDRASTNKVGSIDSPGGVALGAAAVPEWELVRSRCSVLADDINASGRGSATAKSNLSAVIALVEDVLQRHVAV